MGFNESCRLFLKGEWKVDKYQKISRILCLIFIANIILATIKILIAIKFNSNSLLADGYHALSDGAANIIGLIGIKLSKKPADEKHPYGYHKFETIASFIIGILLFLIGIQIVDKAITWFIKPSTPTIDGLSLIFLGIGLVINIIIALSEYQQGKKLHSEVLIADSIHTRSDILISLGVIVSLILINFGAPAVIDPILSLVISVIVFHSAYKIFKDSIEILVDRKVIDEKRICEIIYESDQDIINVHKIRSRGKKDHVYIDLHLIVAPEKTVREAHELNHKLERILNLELERKVDLNCHIEPNER
ncbi:MAG: cation diffusion facilitator family transporter [Bacilli bacterium]|nr:cation diffusion facilitator family transporter [Bacilli bacterium]